MPAVKLIFCILLSFGSVVLLYIVRGKKQESKILKSLVILAMPIRIIGCLVVYIFWPELNQSSDAVLYYYPQTASFLSGNLPYVDFATSYSPFFHVYLALALSLWPSVGGIVMMMNLTEIIMLLLYVRRCKNRDFNRRWQVAFLYYFSPISVYWIGLAGYNGPIISLFTMIALVGAENRRNYLAGSAAVLGFLTSKLLAVLAWPAVIFFERRNWLKRMLPLTVLAIIFGIMLAIGVNVLQPIQNEFGRYTSGNLPFIISAVFTSLQNNQKWYYVPIIVYSLLMIYFCIVRIKSEGSEIVSKFDRSVALTAISFLLFMIISRKSYTMYTPMMLVFIIHSLVSWGRESLWRYVPLALIGSVTTIEPYLQNVAGIRFQDYALNSWIMVVIFGISIVLVTCYVYLLTVSVRVMIGEAGFQEGEGDI